MDTYFLAKRIVAITAIMGVAVFAVFLVSPQKIRLLTARLTHGSLATVGTVFADSMTADGLLEETGTMEESTSAHFWLNSGAYFYETGSISNTVQGDLDQESAWYKEYEVTNPEDSDNGLHPQNIFRLVSRSDWDNTEQQVYFKVKKYNLSESANRNASNGLLLMDRYQDADNLYYIGVRVDGQLVIKKKQNGNYYTIAEQKLFDGEYDGNKSLIPEDIWIGIKSKVVTLPDTTVAFVLSTDVGETGTWTEQLRVVDDGKTYGDGAILGPAHQGIRTDFMDVLFTGYRTEEIDPNISTQTTGTFALSVEVINDDGGNADTSSFSLTVNDSSIKNNETLDLEEGTYTLAVGGTDYAVSYSEACANGSLAIVKGNTTACTVTFNDVASVSSGGGGATPEEDSSLNDILDSDEQEKDLVVVSGASDTKVAEEKVPEEIVTLPKIQTINTVDKVSGGDTSIRGEQLEAIVGSLPVKKIVSPFGTVISSLDPEQVLGSLQVSVETRSLYYGIRSPEVKVLQAFLSTDPTIYPSQYVTGYFGPLTLQAVRTFQKKYGLLSGVELLMPRYGIVGPKTIEKINEIYSSVSPQDKNLFSFTKGE